MGPVVLDASVLIAFFSSRDVHHHDATALVRSLLAQRRSLLISAVTYAEILVHPLRQSDESAIDEFLERARISIVPMDRAIAAAAARLRAFDALKLPDAMTCATADACGAELATFDDDQRARHATAGDRTSPERHATIRKRPPTLIGRGGPLQTTASGVAYRRSRREGSARQLARPLLAARPRRGS